MIARNFYFRAVRIWYANRCHDLARVISTFCVYRLTKKHLRAHFLEPTFGLLWTQWFAQRVGPNLVIPAASGQKGMYLNQKFHKLFVPVCKLRYVSKIRYFCIVQNSTYRKRTIQKVSCENDIYRRGRYFLVSCRTIYMILWVSSTAVHVETHDTKVSCETVCT